MSGYKPTDLPWVVVDQNGGSYIFDYTIMDSDDHELAHCNKEEAPLFAAAPELLEELEKNNRLLEVHRTTLRLRIGSDMLVAGSVINEEEIVTAQTKRNHALIAKAKGLS